MVEAMTANEIRLFFRDTKPFDQFKQIVMPALLKNRPNKTIRIWSAALFQRPGGHSLAMILTEMAPSSPAGASRSSAPISRPMPTGRREGVYSQFEVQRGLLVTLLVKHFAQTGDRWQISQKIRSMVQYKMFNLLHDPSMLGKVRRGVLPQCVDLFSTSRPRPRCSARWQTDAVGRLSVPGGAETVLGISTGSNWAVGRPARHLWSDRGRPGQGGGRRCRRAIALPIPRPSIPVKGLPRPQALSAVLAGVASSWSRNTYPRPQTVLM